jgi:hypothetical protein
LFEDRHAQTQAREAGCRDTAAIARTDDDRIVGRHRFAERLWCSSHGVLKQLDKISPAACSAAATTSNVTGDRSQRAGSLKKKSTHR